MEKIEELGNWDGDVLIYNFKDGTICSNNEMIGDCISIRPWNKIDDGVFGRTELKNNLPVQNEFRYNIDSFSFLLIRQGKLLVCHLSLFGVRLDAWREANLSLGFTICKSMYLLYKHLAKVNEIKQLRKKIKRKLRWKRK